MDNQELLQAIETMLDKRLDVKLKPINERLSNIETDIVGMKDDIAGMKDDIAGMKDDIEILKEDSAITRSGVNTLLEWAEQAQIEVKIPLYKKAE